MLITIIILTLTREEGMVINKNAAVNKWRIKPTPASCAANRSFDSEQKMVGKHTEFLGGLLCSKLYNFSFINLRRIHITI